MFRTRALGARVDVSNSRIGGASGSCYQVLTSRDGGGMGIGVDYLRNQQCQTHM